MSQLIRVKTVLETTQHPLALWQIKEAIYERFNRIDSEAGISARIRDIRHKLTDKRVYSARVHGAKYWVYQII